MPDTTTPILGLKNDHTTATTLSATQWVNKVADYLDAATRGIGWMGQGIINTSDYTIASVAGQLAVDVYPATSGGGAIVGNAGNRQVQYLTTTTRVSSLASNQTNYIYLQSSGAFTHNTTGTAPANSLRIAAASTGTGQASSVDNVSGRTHVGQALFGRRLVYTRNSISVAGSADVTLNSTQYDTPILELTGALGASINVVVVTEEGRFWVVYNNTSGSYTLTVKTAAGTGVAVPQGAIMGVYCNGTNVVAASAGTTPGTGVLPIAGGGTGATTAATARTNLGVVIGTDVQAWDTDLDWVAANITAAGKAVLDDADAAAQRVTLGVAIGTNVQAWSTVLDDLSGASPTLTELGIGVADATVPLDVEGQGFFRDSAHALDPGGGVGPGTRIGYLAALDAGYVDARNTGVAYKDLVLQVNGGNVGIGTGTGTLPAAGLEILRNGGQLRISQTQGVDYVDMTVDADGYCTLSPSGSRMGLGVTPRGLLDVATGYVVGTGLELPHVVKKTAAATVRNSHDVEATTQATVYTKLKTITLSNGLVGQARFLFDLKTSNVLNTATARVYRNGVALGAEQTDVTGGYVTKSEDITQTWNPTDTCELWAKIDNAAQTCYVRNFRIAYDDAATVTVLSANS